MRRIATIDRPDAWLIALTFVTGVCGAAYLIWPELFDNMHYITDVRQQPNWAAYHTSAFRPGDLLIKYAEFNESPIQNLIYYVGTYFVDMLTLGKIITIVSYGCCSALFFVLCRSMFDWRTGLLASVSFCFFPDQIEFFSSGFSKAWMIPLMFLCLYLLHTGRHPWLVALMPFAALAYPPAAVMTGLMISAHVVLSLREEIAAKFRLLRHLAAGTVLAVAILCVKYASPPELFGAMPPGHALRAMAEMYEGGLAPYLPTPRLHEELLRHVGHPATVYSGILFLVILGREKIHWDKTWSTLLLASIVGYVLADLFFMRLYLPNRYLRHSMAILLILWNSRNWALILAELRWRWVRHLALVGVVAVGAFLYRDEIERGKWTLNRTRYEGVCAFLRTLPEQILIAGHPRTLDDIPVQAHRSVLCNYKQAHPWFTAYYGEIRERTYASLAALYASENGPVDELHRRYGVTHMVLDNRYLRRGTRYRNPYNNFLRTLYERDEPFILRRPPEPAILYQDSRYTVIKLPLLSTPLGPKPSAQARE